MKRLKTVLIERAIASITTPIQSKIDTNNEDYLKKVGLKKLCWRALKRLIPLKLSGQKKLLLPKLDLTKHKRCLWLYYDAPQIGDALMDLAPRSLLNDLGVKIDLFTHEHIAKLFIGDQLFNRVESDPSKIDCQQYDFVIVTNFTWRALRHKQTYAKKLPWVSIFAEFTGPEVNRSLLSTLRLAELTNTKLSQDAINRHSSQKLILSDSNVQSIKNKDYMVLAIGGVDMKRTYRGWNELLYEIEKKLKLKKVLLVGSQNGLDDAVQIMAQSHKLNIQNFVNETSLKECLSIMQKAKAIIAADGGLMHLAVSSEAPLISLFHNEIKPLWRLPQRYLPFAISSSSEFVNDINVKEIIQKLALIDKF
jgi:heptosyltransferase-2